MDFTTKNFRYATAEFGDFARRVGQGDKLYLRALSQEKPSEKPALLADDFPTLAPDFVLPPQLSLVEENLFSSVLRVSGSGNMWLHYDVSQFVLLFLILLFIPFLKVIFPICSFLSPFLSLSLPPFIFSFSFSFFIFYPFFLFFLLSSPLYLLSSSFPSLCFQNYLLTTSL